MVAPIALYPDPLISQILVASTYPLEMVQATQWMQRNTNLRGEELTNAASQQNWDPSVQALVAFPDLLPRLTQDITWVTNLGNAFMNQQADVMDAVQRMRQQAQDAGRLQSNEQQQVSTTYDDGRPAIQIQPVDPYVIYVPDYDPGYVWGPYVYYPYPRWRYPHYNPGIYIGFGFGIPMRTYYGASWGGWGGYGWRPGWGGRQIVVNNTFIYRNNVNARPAFSGAGNTYWRHDQGHRQGVPYTRPVPSGRMDYGRDRVQSPPPRSATAPEGRTRGQDRTYPQQQQRMPQAPSPRTATAPEGRTPDMRQSTPRVEPTQPRGGDRIGARPAERAPAPQATPPAGAVRTAPDHNRESARPARTERKKEN
jgi:hypothetical protein